MPEQQGRKEIREAALIAALSAAAVAAVHFGVDEIRRLTARKRRKRSKKRKREAGE